MKIYKNRYQANKDKRGDQRIVKVDGGYILMTYAEYEIWRKQK